MNGNTLSLGRNFASADQAEMTNFGDEVRVMLKWNDGGYVYWFHTTKAEAVAKLATLGFYPGGEG